MTKYFVMKDEYGSPKAPPVSCRQVPKQQEKEECTQVDSPDNLAKHQYIFCSGPSRGMCPGAKTSSSPGPRAGEMD